MIGTTIVAMVILACVPLSFVLMSARTLAASQAGPTELIVSVKSGPWSDAGTWKGGKVPSKFKRCHRRWTFSAFFLTGLLALGSQDNNRQLQQSLKDSDVHASWIYNDVAAGFAAAKKTGKPLLVVFR